MKYLFETERLVLREFNLDDAGFIIELVNSEGWLRFIGDRNIKTPEQAKAYLLNGPIKSYLENGFGLSLVELKDGKKPIGMCGIIKRDHLDFPDIGFAFLPEFMGKGYGFEIANKTLEYAKNVLKLKQIKAITNQDNFGSIRLLEKIGLVFEKKVSFPNESAELLMFSC